MTLRDRPRYLRGSGSEQLEWVAMGQGLSQVRLPHEPASMMLSNVPRAMEPHVTELQESNHLSMLFCCGL